MIKANKIKFILIFLALACFAFSFQVRAQDQYSDIPDNLKKEIMNQTELGMKIQLITKLNDYAGATEKTTIMIHAAEEGDSKRFWDAFTELAADTACSLYLPADLAKKMVEVEQVLFKYYAGEFSVAQLQKLYDKTIELSRSEPALKNYLENKNARAIANEYADIIMDSSSGTAQMLGTSYGKKINVAELMVKIYRAKKYAKLAEMKQQAKLEVEMEKLREKRAYVIKYKELRDQINTALYSDDIENLKQLLEKLNVYQKDMIGYIWWYNSPVRERLVEKTDELKASLEAKIKELENKKNKADREKTKDEEQKKKEEELKRKEQEALKKQEEELKKQQDRDGKKDEELKQQKTEDEKISAERKKREEEITKKIFGLKDEIEKNAKIVKSTPDLGCLKKLRGSINALINYVKGLNDITDEEKEEFFEAIKELTDAGAELDTLITDMEKEKNDKEDIEGKKEEEKPKSAPSPKPWGSGYHNKFVLTHANNTLFINVVNNLGKSIGGFTIGNVSPGQYLMHEGAIHGGYNSAFLVTLNGPTLNYYVLTPDKIIFAGNLDMNVKNINDVQFSKTGDFGISVKWKNSQGQIWGADIDQWKGLTNKVALGGGGADVKVAKGNHTHYYASTDGRNLTVTVKDFRGNNLNQYNFGPVMPGNVSIAACSYYGGYNTGFLTYIKDGYLKWAVLTPDKITFSGTFDTDVTSFAVNKVMLTQIKQYGVDYSWVNNKGQKYAGHIQQFKGFVWKKPR
ncbi:MAG: hypothetical protein ABIH00_04065 [Armatimonadota bacterium]